jgi:acetylornithine/succinyldiaminopimelate/putrescine aminotransferase
VPEASEADVIERLGAALAGGTVAAVFLEPVQGVGGGHAASAPLAREVRRLCDRTGTLLVLDEILTGFWRTGTAFVWQALGVVPDVLLLGKAMGNGFPVSAVAARRDIAVTKAMLPGSTFSGNPLAASAVVATLEEMNRLPMAELVRSVASTIESVLSPLSGSGFAVRGKGALWAIEPPPGLDGTRLTHKIYERGVAVGNAGQLIRLSPAATIDLGRLRDACAVVKGVLHEARAGGQP